MKHKTHRPLSSQVRGVLWISITLLILIAIRFFSSANHSDAPATDSLTDSATTFLLQKEDSAYAERRKTKYYSHSEYDKHETYTPQAASEAPAPPVRRQPLTVELNSADSLTLQLLHGIGPSYARRIVRYRERLGGFTSTNQLLEVYGFTPELLAHIEPHLTLDRSTLRRIPINSIPLKELIRHPYIEYYQARDIVSLRNRGVVFHNADDLRAIPSMADTTLQRLLPYIDFADTATTKHSPTAQ